MARRVLLGLVLGLAGCFSPDHPTCAFACGPGGECPDDYSCQPDGYCHYHGAGVCPFPDAAAADLSPQDMGPGDADM